MPAVKIAAEIRRTEIRETEGKLKIRMGTEDRETGTAGEDQGRAADPDPDTTIKVDRTADAATTIREGHAAVPVVRLLRPTNPDREARLPK